MHAQIVADALGDPVRGRRGRTPPTRRVPDSGPTVASRTCMVVGRILAALRGEMRARLGAPRRRASTCARHGPLVDRRRSTSRPPEIDVGRRHLPRRRLRQPTAGAATSPRSRSIRTRARCGRCALTAVHEVGKAIHPGLAAGQIEGGTAQGLGLRAARERRDARRPHGERAAHELHRSRRRCDTPHDRRRRCSRSPYPARPVRREGRRRAADRRPGAGGRRTRSGTPASTCARFPATPERVDGGGMRLHAERPRASSVDAQPMKRLLDVLREDVRPRPARRKAAAKASAARARCWSTARPVNSCLVPVAQVDGRARRRRSRGCATATRCSSAFVDRGRRAVRHLHAGDDPGGASRSAAEADARGRSAAALAGQPLPLHRLRGDLPRRSRQRAEAKPHDEDRRLDARRSSRRARCARRSRMLRDEGPLVAARRLHRPLRRAELRHARRATRFLDLWPLERARGGSRCAATTLVDRRARDLHGRSCARRSCGSASADARRRRARDRRRRRSRIAARSAATSRTRRRPATRCPVLAAADAIVVLAQRARASGASPFTEFYTGYRETVLRAGRADRRDRGPAGRRPAVVPQGRHARGAGDLEGRDGRGAAGATPRDRARQRRADGRARCRARRRRSPRAASIDEARARSRRARSRRSTTCGRPPTTGGGSRRTCWRRFWSEAAPVDADRHARPPRRDFPAASPGVRPHRGRSDRARRRA